MVLGTVSHKMWDEKGINGCQKTRIYWKKKSRGERLLMKIRRKMNTKSLFYVSETGEQDRTDDDASSEYTYLYGMYAEKF